jgi:hypothetical protein
MALADFAPAARSSIAATLLRGAGRWLAARGAARAKAVALNDLLFMPPHRLRDLGIDPPSVHQSLDARFWPTRK